MIRGFLVLLMIVALDSCGDTKLSSSLKTAHVIENQTFTIVVPKHKDIPKSSAKLTSDFTWRFIDFVARSDGHGILLGNYRLRFHDFTWVSARVRFTDKLVLEPNFPGDLLKMLRWTSEVEYIDQALSSNPTGTALRQSLKDSIKQLVAQSSTHQEWSDYLDWLRKKEVAGSDLSEIEANSSLAFLLLSLDADREDLTLKTIRLKQIIFLDSYELPILSIDIGSYLEYKYKRKEKEKESSITSTFSVETTLEAINQIKYVVPVVIIGDQEIRYSLSNISL